MPTFSDKIPTWANDEDAKKYQKIAWEAVEKELETIEPGCVKKVTDI